MGPDALALLVDRHAAALTLYARQWCGSAEDVVQTAFLKLVRQRTMPENVAAWLFRVVRNAAIDAGRAARRRQKYETQAASEAPLWFVPTEDPTGLDARTAAAALGQLPDEIREIMVAHLWGGLTFEQIAEMVGGSASTCYRRFALGLDLLRDKLGVKKCPPRTTPTR
ncbi:RNA polymerase sigma factor [Limnoglobus roseus]|uniref:Sigma-70 family RNA polymerase sigma factor n=1 Tax=Limnoglobus roseus TaxID=2598579 RepID=A0A5C1ADB5_9BACT|nr:sigma-70 family RNA polymerase sigma factor [Limnoglobus roseus]QEL15048.1 sigma-70 family RNA polymerase sigma factor [Limnoglobus roseus]